MYIFIYKGTYLGIASAILYYLSNRKAYFYFCDAWRESIFCSFHETPGTASFCWQI